MGGRMPERSDRHQTAIENYICSQTGFEASLKRSILDANAMDAPHWAAVRRRSHAFFTSGSSVLEKCSAVDPCGNDTGVEPGVHRWKHHQFGVGGASSQS